SGVRRGDVGDGSVRSWLSGTGEDGRVHSCFFQAEDGIRDDLVTGVQTCALPISRFACAPRASARSAQAKRGGADESPGGFARSEIGRASCRERAHGGGRATRRRT